MLRPERFEPELLRRQSERDDEPWDWTNCPSITTTSSQLPLPPVAEGVVIRPERDADHPVIAGVVRAAFVAHPDEVASFVERIRALEEPIPGSRWSPRTPPV